MISKINNTTIKANPIPVPPIFTPPVHKLDTIIYPLLHYVNPYMMEWTNVIKSRKSMFV